MDEITTDDFVLDATGEPGARTFWIQLRDAGHTITIKAEKEQVEVLAEKVIEMLDTVADDVGADPIEPAPDLSLVEPLQPRFRLGSIALGYDEASDQMIVQLEEWTPDEDEGLEDDSGAEGDAVRVRMSRTRLRSVAVHALDVVEGGRPACVLCGLPRGEVHVCPRTNGKRDSLGS